MSFIRLQKYMADCGVASRRKSEDLIKQGSVKVNGEVVRELGTKIDPEEDRVMVNNKEISVKDDYLFYMFNKNIRIKKSEVKTCRLSGVSFDVPFLLSVVWLV